MFSKLSDEEFNKFAKLIHEMSGIYLKDSKNTLLSNRLRKRLIEKKIDSFDEYYRYLETSKDMDEITEMLNAVSTNETYFFRNIKHFETLFDSIIPELISKRRLPVSIWSAGCSSGEEPYTLCMIAKEKGLLNKGLIKIDASDINTSVINEAKSGIYDDKRLRSTEKYYEDKYFKRTATGLFKLDQEIIDYVNFFKLNLITDKVDKKYDIILCRNVMIYFDRDDQKKVVAKFYESLNNDSYFFVGHSESLYFIDTRFEYKKVLDSPVYYKK